MEIRQIDPNFEQNEIEDAALQFFNPDLPPFKLYGLLPHNGTLPYQRVPQDVASKVNAGVEFLAGTTAGGRLRFRTNTKTVAVSVLWSELTRMNHMPLSGSSGFDLFEENANGIYHLRSFIPTQESDKGFTAQVDLGSSQARDLLIHFPLYQRVSSLRIGLDKNSFVTTSSTEYLAGAPIVFYGSSITQGGCASIPGNAYPAIVSRMLQCDHINLGFSGGCRGEVELARYIAAMPMRAFVMDYDHNAPDIAHLRATHEKFYRIVRNSHPEIPVLFLSKPDFHTGDILENAARREIIQATYLSARKNGDSAVAFLDGEKLLDRNGMTSCTVDGTHPNDYGFACMAEKVSRVLAGMLGISLHSTVLPANNERKE